MPIAARAPILPELGRLGLSGLFGLMAPLTAMCGCGHLDASCLATMLPWTVLMLAWAHRRPRLRWAYALALAWGCLFLAQSVADVGWRGHEPLFQAPPPLLLVPVQHAALLTFLGVGYGTLLWLWKRERLPGEQAGASPAQ